MLTLKKERGNNNYSLALFSRQSMFSRDFCLALSWAVGIHALGLLIFTIQMITYTGSMTILDPVTVLTEPLEFSREAAVITDAISVEHSTRQLSEPPSTPLEPPSFIHDAFLADATPLSFSFTLPDWTVHSFSPPPVKVTTLGHLAGLPFHSSASTPLIKMYGDYKIVYQVRVDEGTGEIFWYKLQKSSGFPTVDKAAETILRQIHFQSIFSGPIASGSIEIAFHLDTPYD